MYVSTPSTPCWAPYSLSKPPDIDPYPLFLGEKLTTANQVLRWSALGFGVFYGFSHQSSITTRDKLAQAKHEYEKQQGLIQQAKAEWARTHPSETKSSGTPTPTQHVEIKVGWKIDMELTY